MILKFLLHPHAWLRNIPSRLVTLYFAALAEAGKSNNDKLDAGPPYLANPSRISVIAVSLLNQLKAPLSDDDATNNLVIQNLVFSIYSLHNFAKQRSGSKLHEFWSALDHRDQSSYLEAFHLLGSSKAKDLFLLATTDADQISQAVNQTHQDSNKNLHSLLVAPLLKRMGKIAADMEDIQVRVIA